MQLYLANAKLYWAAPSLGGEYNITGAAGSNITFAERKYNSGGAGIKLAIRRVWMYDIREVIGMAESIMRDRAKAFAKEIVILCRQIKAEHKESVLSNQLLRSGTSVGANLHEAQYAQGTKDFISKFEIALKECNESEYWLELLHETGYIPDQRYKTLHNDCGAIRRMLIASINTVKGR